VVDVDAPKPSVSLAVNSTIVYATNSSTSWVASKKRKSRFDAVLPTTTSSLAENDSAEAVMESHDAAVASLQQEKEKEEEPLERNLPKNSPPRSPSSSSSSSSSSSGSSRSSASASSRGSSHSKSSKK
jgi:hypothetical protein